jgi:hypothetical protein
MGGPQCETLTRCIKEALPPASAVDFITWWQPIYPLSFFFLHCLLWLCCSELVGRLVSGDFALSESICQVIAEAFAVQATL